MQFIEKKLEWRSYTTIEALFTSNKMKFIDEIEFVTTTLDKNTKTFVVYITTLLAALAI